MAALFRDAADVSVRPAAPGDEDAIARIQVAAWRASHHELLGPDVLDRLDTDAVRSQWAAAVTAPPTPLHRVLVACEGARVVGFAASVPVDGPSAPGVELIALEVWPEDRGGGHGSRLLTASVDLARERGAAFVRAWVLAGDEGRERFLAGAGLGPDGRSRSLGTEAQSGPTITEHRWAAEL